MFIYGGDSQDKGFGDIRFVTMLLKFKKEYGERVILIIGNRDINKLRLRTELKDECIEKIIGAESIEKWIYWDKNLQAKWNKEGKPLKGADKLTVLK
jgi:hypothetical protein